MIKRKVVFITTVCLIIISGSLVFAACPDIKGNWNFTVNQVFYNSDVKRYGYEGATGIFHITNQQGCRFYGQIEVTGDPQSNSKLTGVIDFDNRGITIKADDESGQATFNGNLLCQDTVCTRMRFTYSFSGYSFTEFGTGRGTATKQ